MSYPTTGKKRLCFVCGADLDSFGPKCDFCPKIPDDGNCHHISEQVGYVYNEYPKTEKKEGEDNELPR